MLIFTRSESGPYTSVRICVHPGCNLGYKSKEVLFPSVILQQHSNMTATNISKSNYSNCSLISLPRHCQVCFHCQMNESREQPGQHKQQGSLNSIQQQRCSTEAPKTQLTNTSFSKVRWTYSGTTPVNEKLHFKLTTWKSNLFNTGSLYLKHTAHSFDFVNRHCANTRGETPVRSRTEQFKFWKVAPDL